MLGGVLVVSGECYNLVVVVLPHCFEFENSKNTRNELARPVMGTVFLVVFSCTVWTKMKSLAGSLADGVLAGAILIPHCPPILPTNISMVRGRKKYGN